VFETMGEEAHDWFADLVAQGRNGFDWEMRPWMRTVRRKEIYRGLFHLASSELFGDGIDEVLEALVYAASDGDDATLFANVTPGVALGALDARQATTFSKLVDDLIAGRQQAVADEATGALRLHAA
jgi:hypothetical protein